MALAQSGMDDLERGIRDQLAAGNRVAASEYLRAGGSRLRNHMSQQSRLGQLETFRKAAASQREAKRAAMVKGLDVYAEQTGRLDTHLRGIEDRLGLGDPDSDPDTPRHNLGRVVELWHETAVSAGSDAGIAEAQAYEHAATELGTADL
jgi:Arc/MetJ-type ribon-helix-helix transcriptional regulator